MSKPLLISIHNYKTAGVTFFSIIDRQFKREEIINSNLLGVHNTYKFLAESSETSKRKVKIIHGHIPFGLDVYFPQKSSYLTFVRNPIERIISDYYYCKSFPLAHNYPYASKMTFKEYLSCKEILNIDNGQTRFLAGDMDTAFGDTTQELLDRAIKNIENRFSFVGITERFDESLVLANYLFSWNKFYYKAQNVTSEKTIDFDEETMVLLNQRNQFDLKLYQYALDRHQQIIKKVPCLWFRMSFLAISKFLYNSIHPLFTKVKILIR